MAEHAGQASPGETRPEHTSAAGETAARATAAGETAAGEKAAAPAGPELPASGAPGPTSGKPGPAAAESKRWELVIAVAIALVTVTGAVLTYLSIQQESAAVEADRQSVVETLTVQNQVVSAATEARAYGILAARYRQFTAEASVLAATDPQQSDMFRADAAGLWLGGVTNYLTGTGATAQYNFGDALRGALAVNQSFSIPPDEPSRTAATAERHRQAAGGLALCVVGLLCVVVVLTLARLLKPDRLKRALLGAGTAGYLAAVITATVQLT